MQYFMEKCAQVEIVLYFRNFLYHDEQTSKCEKDRSAIRLPAEGIAPLQTQSGSTVSGALAYYTLLSIVPCQFSP